MNVFYDQQHAAQFAITIMLQNRVLINDNSLKLNVQCSDNDDDCEWLQQW